MRRMTFLVVEDSPAMRQLIGFALKRFPDCRILQAVDGADALRTMAYEPIDVLITDINMPIMDGLKLVKVVRGNPAMADLPIIIVTTEGADADRERGMKLGADAYVAKPMEAGDLVRTVNEVLKRKAAARPSVP
ncbi:MAG: response regulator [Acidobacteriota bacterium]